MSAAEVIEQIKALPKPEQAQVFEFVQKEVRHAEAQGGTSSEPIELIATRIFDRYDPLFRKLAE